MKAKLLTGFIKSQTFLGELKTGRGKTGSGKI
jgi:hypothetical protein